jgi:hypothetical protein
MAYAERLQRVLNVANGAVALDDVVEHPAYHGAKTLRSHAQTGI